MLRGAPLAREAFDEHVGGDIRAALVATGLASDDGTEVALAVTILEIGGVLAVIPKHPWGDHVVYLGPDSAHLIEAVLRLAPRGERAAELGTGTGLLAALLATRYRSVIATDIHPSVTAAAALTFALNRRPAEHRVGVCLADIAAGLRPGAFDLVATNAPWVPLAAASDAPRELFAHGGETGFELPARFLLEGASLLVPGGLAVTMALDVTCAAGAPVPARPLDDVCDAMRTDGYYVDVVPTPFNRERPRLPEVVRRRQPWVEEAVHVAIVVRRPRPDGAGPESLRIAVDALRRRWATREVTAVIE